MRYFILEITKPGSWLEHLDDKTKNNELRKLIDQLIQNFYEANTCLNLYLQQVDNSHNTSIETENGLRQKAFEEFQKTEINNLSYKEKNFQQNVYIKKYLWRNGIPPRTLQGNKIFIYARMYMFSIDNFSKILNVLVNRSYEPPVILDDILKDFNKLFPDIRGVRNSAHHLEDIIRLKGKIKNKIVPIELKPVDNLGIRGVALITNSLINNKYGQTMANGEYGEVEVSIETFSELRSLLQKIIDSYKWEGQQEHLPN
jgi:hypothetical protein